MDHTRAGEGPPETGPSADDPLAPLFARHGAVVLDGGLATQLEAQGNSLTDPLWSARLLLENPGEIVRAHLALSLIHISEPTRLGMISYAVFCLKKKKQPNT